MKKYIKKQLGELGRTYSQLYKGLKIRNIVTDYMLWFALCDLVRDGEVIKCQGGYYGLNRVVA